MPGGTERYLWALLCRILIGDMSNTSLTIDAAQELANWTRRVTGMYVKDLRAMSNEAYTTSAGGKCRSMQDVTAEVAGYNYMIATVLKQETPPSWSDQERADFIASLNTVEAGIDQVQKSGEMLAEAIENAGDMLSEMGKAPWGEPMSYFQMAQICVNHILYHDGQLNIIQALNGDDQMHWFDE